MNMIVVGMVLPSVPPHIYMYLDIWYQRQSGMSCMEMWPNNPTFSNLGALQMQGLQLSSQHQPLWSGRSQWVKVS